MGWQTLLDADSLERWLADQDAAELELGSEGWRVEILEQILEQIDPDLYDGAPDDVYGSLCRRGVEEFQQYRLLEETGACGSKTRCELGSALRTGWRPGSSYLHTLPNGVEALVYGPVHPRFGRIPGLALGRIERGRISHYGGPADKGDRCEGQAYIKPDAATPRLFLATHPKLIEMGVLMSEEQALAFRHRGQPVIKDIDKWPIVKDYRGRMRKAGASALLNSETGFYIAARWRKENGLPYNKRGAGNPRMMLWNERTGVAGVGLQADWGPSANIKDSKGRKIEPPRWVDISPPFMKLLGLRTDDFVRGTWVPDSVPLGPVDGSVTLPTW